MPTVELIYRKRRASSNYSIETSFATMTKYFRQDDGWTLREFTSSHYSNGLVPRLKAIREMSHRKADLYHITGDVHHLALGLPGRRTILTIHDCGFLHRTNFVRRELLRQLWLKVPTRHCAQITAISEATKHEIVAHTKCDPERISVIPTVIDDGFERVDRPFNETRPRILHIGLKQNKNFERHLAALRGLACDLHIIGPLNDEHRAMLAANQIAYTCEDSLSYDCVRRAYAAADIVLFASTFEGFGMPIIEAQTVGRPVVTSNLSSMPEVAGSGACFVDPYDVLNIREGLERVIRDRAYREALVKQGFSNAARYSPSAVACRYAALYKDVLGRRS